LILRAQLVEKENIHFSAVYAETHSNAMRHVLYGRSDAAGAVVQTLNRQDAEARNNLRILYQSPGMVSHPIVVHPRVSENLHEKITSLMVALGRQKKGSSLLKAISMSMPVRSEYKRDYAVLEQLNLERYRKHSQEGRHGH
jgi:phosphonate transport system substrate-binding protein